LKKDKEEKDKKDKKKKPESITQTIIDLYIKCEKKYDNAKPIFINEIAEYMKEKNDELKVLIELGNNGFEDSLYLLLTLLEITDKNKVEKVDKYDSIESELLYIQYELFEITIKHLTTKLNGFMESMMKDDQCFKRRNGAEFEQVTAAYIPKYLENA